MTEYSVIVLLEEESEGFSGFIESLHHLFNRRRESFEIIIIANGTEGYLINEINILKGFGERIKLYALNRKASQAVCLKAALKESHGEIIVICGSYQQITDKSFNHLLDSFDSSVDIVSPWRQGRVDPLLNQLQSRIFNMIVNQTTKTALHDLSCTVKIVHRKVLEEVELYGNMYRFLPVLAGRRGFSYKEITCEHHQERGKTGFYSFSEYAERIIDIIILYFNTYFARKPLRFFGSIGISFLLTGLLMLSIIFLQKIVLNYSIGGRPVFMLLGFLLVALGVQSISVGLLAEIIVFINGRYIKEYTVSEYFSDQYKGIERRRNNNRLLPNYRGTERRMSLKNG